MTGETNESRLPLDPKQWKEFERLIAELHEQPGASVNHNVKLKGRSGQDHQIDCVVEYTVGLYTFKVLVSCKDWKRKVDVSHVNELVGVMADCDANKGVIASVSGFTSGALKVAKSKGIELLHLKPMTSDDWARELGIRRIESTIEMAVDFDLKDIKLHTNLTEMPPPFVGGFGGRQADLFNSAGEVVGNVNEILFRGLHERRSTKGELEELVIEFPKDAHLRADGKKIPVQGVWVKFVPKVISQQVVIDLATVFKAVLENIVSGERHRVTNDNKLLPLQRKDVDS
ncbi:restriction endonuclease [Pyxidicoccus fallax]|uniref:Restriction endonuclease n=1 Tax=Pyxidicoccus fallax TaxID=394095 RepID=A0A848LIG0_9BACT|nr:restriction endonuclease [Pyxidicoccus fallax]NMO17486.1 restriction endonuclease [Pyxidicoccus fallax]NPC77719.1 restriction endonuclease [Pyxidicoccus fallax]